MKVLVCGGAGYIGSHLVRELLKTHSVIVLDNFSTGHACVIPESVQYEKCDIRDKNQLDHVFEKYKPDAVMHFCASIEVAESCKDPLKYYENNVSGTITLLQAMRQHSTKYFVFSSTAALFGHPVRSPIESHDIAVPINPYGQTKLAVEQLLKWCDKAYDLKYVCLRYFNACGADIKGDIGEDHAHESHLIPLILQVPLRKREYISVFGNDYETRDGTCVRDYVHVSDLASAHVLALDYMIKENKSDCFNLGSGRGYTVKEIIEAARTVTGHTIPCRIEERRQGDPDSLIASSEKAEKVLGWKRQFESIEDIVKSAWVFHQNYPNGFQTGESI